jgi:hypothetical protein
LPAETVDVTSVDQVVQASDRVAVIHEFLLCAGFSLFTSGVDGRRPTAGGSGLRSVVGRLRSIAKACAPLAIPTLYPHLALAR